MIKRLLLWGVVALALTSFILILNSGSYLKKPLHPQEDIMNYLSLVTDHIQRENWTLAQENYDRVVEVWPVIKKRISFSTEHDQVERFEETLEQLGASIRVREPVTALRDLAVLRKTYDNFK